MSDTLFAWTLLTVFVLTFYFTYTRLLRYLNKRWPRR